MLADFGLVGKRGYAGTRDYMAPEEDCGELGDAFSVGLIIYEVMCEPRRSTRAHSFSVGARSPWAGKPKPSTRKWREAHLRSVTPTMLGNLERALDTQGAVGDSHAVVGLVEDCLSVQACASCRICRC